MTRSVAAIIPARYASSRLPGKPLLRETGRTLIEHVYERVSAAKRIATAIVATDDPRIAEAVRAFGGEVQMTSPDHPSGTDRIAEVAANTKHDAFLNVQGDEPEIDPNDLDRLADAILADDAEIATLATPIHDIETFEDPNSVKVVLGENNRGLYFSRSPIPWHADASTTNDEAPIALKHLGVYAYTRDALHRFVALPPAPLEQRERLEQLRALAHGMRIDVWITENHCVGVDTEEDYRKFVQRWQRHTANPVADSGRAP